MFRSIPGVLPMFSSRRGSMANTTWFPTGKTGNRGAKARRPTLPTGSNTRSQGKGCCHRHINQSIRKRGTCMQYVIKALRGNEGFTELLLEAADAADAEVQAILQGYSVIAIRARKQW